MKTYTIKDLVWEDFEKLSRSCAGEVWVRTRDTNGDEAWSCSAPDWPEGDWVDCETRDDGKRILDAEYRRRLETCLVEVPR